MPEGTGDGLAEITVRSGDRVVATGTARIERVTPGLFSANFNGRGAAAAIALRVAEDGAQTSEPVFRCPSAGNCVAAPIALGPDSSRVFLLLFGTGLRNRTALSAVTAAIGGIVVPVFYAGAQGESRGLDQVNLGPLPGSLAGRGGMEIVLTADGKTANAVTIAVE